MEEKPTGSPVPEATIATAEAAPASEKPPKPRNWTGIALMAVSIIAVLLLASTITMAVTGGFCDHHGCEAPAQTGGRPTGPKQQGPGGGGQQQVRPGKPGNRDNQDRQGQDRQQDQPQDRQQQSPPESQGE